MLYFLRCLAVNTFERKSKVQQANAKNTFIYKAAFFIILLIVLLLLFFESNKMIDLLYLFAVLTLFIRLIIIKLYQ